MATLNRRGWLGAMAAGVLAPAVGGAAPRPQPEWQVRAKGVGRDYADVLSRLGAYAAREMASVGLPGMTLTVVDAEGFAAVACLGWADVDRRIPVDPSHLFQIGSISKSFAVAALFSLVDDGRVELDAPVSRYLADAALPSEAITVAQLCNHTAGLQELTPIFPPAPGGRLWCGFEPGSKFSYSNTGYELLGHVIAAAGGAPHPEVIRRRVLQPLGMTGVAGVIRSADRARYAVGYSAFDIDAPAMWGARFAPEPWIDMDAAAGSIAATPDDMAAYLRFILKAAKGDGGGVLSTQSARRWTTPVIDTDTFGPKARYGWGLATVLVESRPCLHHTGGMLSFVSSMHLDPVTGVACFASVNASVDGSYRPRQVTAYAVELLRAARAAGPASTEPDPLKWARVESPASYSGIWRSAGGGELELAIGGEGLELRSGGRRGRLARVDDDALATDHPAYKDHLLTFQRTGKIVDRLWWGESLWARDAAPAAPTTPDRLRRLSGSYYSSDRWVGLANVLAQGDRLVLEGVGEITERAQGYWAAAKDVGGVERFWFQGELGGRPYVLNQSGNILKRLADIGGDYSGA